MQCRLSAKAIEELGAILPGPLAFDLKLRLDGVGLGCAPNTVVRTLLVEPTDEFTSFMQLLTRTARTCSLDE
jgi:hypothetical protein